MAHQYLAQLEGSEAKKVLKKSVLKMPYSATLEQLCVIKSARRIPNTWVKEMAPVFSDQDLVNLDKYKACVKLSIDTQPSQYRFQLLPLIRIPKQVTKILAVL